MPTISYSSVVFILSEDGKTKYLILGSQVKEYNKINMSQKSNPSYSDEQPPYPEECR